ncbi:DUF58 domain-containing protein [Pseudoxanthomonas sacheonensis]|uniref:DUF58 domain-containing protein n=1 Tax=Pseudoxanthomonas sacheonensis TaxID=443615 RepID=UPI0013D08778|nr:DUF58 domain-containing protein [Pseudoxanthomonas sacheonensis]KAF1712782.1 DUF58 domain-containing protein [Pseudoxanthomonas sacheonensis]
MTDFASDGIRPTLAELVALRATAQRRPPARKGRYNAAGPAQSSARGRGMEYAESREYVAGDDVRHIDWRLTARSGRTHTKLFQAERERLTLIVADTSPALYFGTRVRYKSVQAARAAAVAVWAAVRDGDRVAILRGSRQEAPVPPASGPRGALRVLDALVRWYSRPPIDDSGLASALDSAARLLRPGSRLIVLADPRSIAAVPESRWPALAMHHEVVVLLLTDALETEPPHALLPFSLGDHRVELDLGNATQRQRWQQEFGRPVESALENLPRRGVRAYSLQGDAPSESWLPLLGRSQSQVA